VRVLTVPSWYPSDEHPTAGIFIQQQVRGLAGQCDAGVLYVRAATVAAASAVAREDGVTVVRACLAAHRVSGSRIGRMRAAVANLLNASVRYRRAGLAAFEALRAEWGMPDIVHVQALWPAGIIARAIKRRYGIPYVVTEHSEEYSAASDRRLVKTPGMVPLVLRPLARGAARTIAVSRILADRLVELGLARDPVVIPNVVPVSPPSPLPLEVPHAIAHVSVMGPAKNLPGLLQAVAMLRARRGDFVLRLVGDGECRADAETLAASLGLGGTVEFSGRRSADEVRVILGDSAFAVVSSLHETFSVVAAEALMCGRPVLSTRCGGPEEYLTPEVGHLVEAGSADALADGLDWMLDHYRDFDPEALHAYARARFAPDVVAARIIDVYREVLGG
jgi:glycosyltransferase involved in cell wall biosynthesis